ncbi:histidine kinase [Amycolatopsis cynarae]|uniref:histidine kinase n=1 Tax=Amycolatopsis cynarae TaxID=2995223 RepID=A0ABY7ATE7_9PSEU|nr:histidine kinase [Amycolatopsis sp. HUAS 11-8]WAL63229.1 histidine kinase [Amycolatopsis sp. HUAS 11-8]
MLERVVDWVRVRLGASLARAGITLPWWVAVCTNGISLALAGTAIGQRHALLPPVLLVASGVLAAFSMLLWLFTARIAPPWLRSATVIAAMAILLLRPVEPDFASVLLVVLAAEEAAISGPVVVISVGVVSLAVLAAAGWWGGEQGVPLYMVAVLLGLSAGRMLRWYVRALDAERDKQDAVRDQAILAERQRIAREVHDVVGHSLSITLLHLTGARRALQEDQDIDEAVDGLTEAERIGRAAMADIRRAVGLLAGAPTSTRPLPGAGDIADLVQRTRAAGLNVRYEQEGDLEQVGASAGLGLYRIVQESLANIAKHAPEAVAEVGLRAGPDGIRLSVRNGLRPEAPRGAGSGLPGMHARAEQLGAELRAGPQGDHWLVEVTVPGVPAPVAGRAVTR